MCNIRVMSKSLLRKAYSKKNKDKSDFFNAAFDSKLISLFSSIMKILNAFIFNN